jgi:hypothetical protein
MAVVHSATISRLSLATVPTPRPSRSRHLHNADALGEFRLRFAQPGRGAADEFTLGLWEVVGTPIEGYANGTKVTIEVTYDKEDRVVQVVPIRGQEKLTE